MLPQNMPIWLEDYFELKTSEIQQMQKETFLGLLLSDQKQKLLRNKAAVNSFSRVSCMAINSIDRHQETPAQTNLAKESLNVLLVPPYIFTAPQFAVPGSLKACSFVL